MILIDESGWGSLIGGVCVGLYDDINREFYTRMISVKNFQGKSFIKKKYLDKVKRITMDGVFKLGIPKRIQVCRGYIFTNARESLRNLLRSKCTIEEVEIKDPLQKYLEGKFAKHLEKLGVPRKSSGAHCLSFDDQLNWVLEDKNRVKHVKTGWDSWQEKYSKLTLKSAKK